MAKRLLAFVLALTLIVSLMPNVTIGVSAEGAQKAPGASQWCDHTSHEGWTAWGDEEAERKTLPTAEGKYYLTADVEMTASVTISANIHLCLNDHTVTQKTAATRHVYLNEGKGITFSLYDCGTKGTITGGSAATGTFINVTRTNTFKMYGGTITGNNSTSDAVIYVQAAKTERPVGGVFCMYGGEISGNKVKNGVVYGAGGGATFTNSQVNIYGGTIKDNEVTGSGGAIYVKSYGSLHVENATITGNKATGGAGSAIYAEGNTPIYIKDTTITGNIGTASSATALDHGYSAAVYMCGHDNTLTVSGKVVISGNTTAAANIADVMFKNNKFDSLQVNELAAGSDIVYRTRETAAEKASEVIEIAKNGTQKGLWQSEWISYMDATGATKNITYGAEGFYFVEGHYHGDVKYVAWDKTNQLPDGDGETGVGYYLANNVTITTTGNRSTVDSGRILHLCLNGHSVNQSIKDAGTLENSELIRVSVGSLYLDDCTTVYDENGYFVSGGKLTGGEKKGNGAALYINKAAAVVEVTGIEFSGNISTQTNEGYGGGGVMVRYNTTPAKFVGCKFADNKSQNTSTKALVGGAGAMALRDGGKATVEKCVFTGNQAKHGAAIFCTGATLTVKDSKFSGNTGDNAAAINILGTSNVTIDSCTITGNSNTSTDGYGAVNLANGSSVVKLVGKTVIYDNLNKDGKQQNLHLQHSTTTDIDYDVSGLTAGSKVGVSLLDDRITAGMMYFSTTGMTANPGYCVSDYEEYEVALNAETTRLELVEKGSVTPPTPPTPPVTEGHTHKLCNDAACTDHGADVTFTKWDNAAELPTEGTYYLDVDVNLTATAATTGNLTLCLNGHTVKQTKSGSRIINVQNGHTFSVTDCGTTGKLTGGSATYGIAISVRHGATFNLFAGTITGNSKTGTGAEGTIYLQGGNATLAGGAFNMYGGEISGNTAQRGGAVSMATAGAETKTAPQANIYGGTIKNNTVTNYGGAINASGVGTINIQGGVITGNNADMIGGAIYTTTGATLTIANAQITGNTAGDTAGGVRIHNGVKSAIISGNTVIQNNTADGAASNVYLVGEAKFTLGTLQTGAKIGLNRAETRNDEKVSTNTVDASVMDYLANDNEEAFVLKQVDGYVVLDVKPITTEHMHNACNDAACTDHEVIPFVKWDKTDSLPESGNYYLANDVELKAAAVVSGDLKLCLNGHTITQTTKNRVFTVNMNVSLSIMDCGTTGTITGGKNDFGSVAYVCEGAIFNLFGGKLTGNGPKTTDGAATGATVFLRSSKGAGATFNMYGGEITGNGGEHCWGGAVSNASGNASNAVYVNIYGGKIYGNTALNGGAIRMENKSVTTIYGGEIYDNTASASGGAIYLTKGAELVLAGGKITGNTAPLGAGVFANTNCQVTVSGSPVLTENKSGKLQNNLYLAGETIITLGDVKEDAKIGVTAAQLNRAISTESDTDYTKNIVSDSAYKTITYQDKVLYIAGSTDHSHCICTDKSSGCDHTEQVWNAWESDSTLPTSGTYYLTCDVQLSEGHYSDYSVKGTLNLCLNGYTVTAYQGKRILMSGKGGTINLTDCNEKPGMLTGGTAAWGAAVNINAGSTFNMYGGKISGNKCLATSGGIGAVYVQGAGATFNMYGGEISGNQSSSGTIYSPGKITEPMYINLYGGTIANNSSVKVKDSAGKTVSTSGRGGGIYASANTIVNIDGGSIKNNTAEADGGGIMLTGSGAVVNMKSGTISGNKAANGGGIITLNYAKLNLNGGTISGNTAKNGGGGAYISTRTELVMNGGSVSGNTAKNGGGIYIYRSTATLAGGTIGNNYAKREVKVTNGKETKSGGTAGGFYGSGAKVTMSGTSVIGNKADSNGGGIVLGRTSYKENGVTKYALVRMDIYGGSVSDNVSGENAGGMLIQSKETVVNMYGGRFTGNKATSNAGAIYVSTDTTFNMTGGTITGNHTEKSGGAFYCYKSTANITGGNIYANTAATSAGMLNAATKPCVVTIKNIKIHGNEAKTAGALVSQSKATLYVENCEIYDNTSTSGQGGAVFISNKYSNGYFTNCKFFDNSSAGMGGAVYCSDFSDSSFTNCEFYRNHSVKQGGALEIYIAATSVIENCIFRENVADDRGGALAIRGDVSMKNCQVENNTAKTDGGGIYTDVNSTTGSGIMQGLEMHNSQIKNNTSGGQGGGFFIFKGCRVELYDVEVTGNKSTAEGGGIWAYEDLELHDTTITGNTSGGEGYAVYMSDANYDGHSYFTSRNKLSGDVVIKDNEGGDLYMGKDVAMAITSDGLGAKAHIEVVLDSGVITNRIFGAYHYEGGEQIYTVTYGDRSITDPEYDASLVPQSEEQAPENTGDIALYAIVGVFAVAVIAVVAVLLAKKKKAGKETSEATKE